MSRIKADGMILARGIKLLFHLVRLGQNICIAFQCQGRIRYSMAYIQIQQVINTLH